MENITLVYTNTSNSTHDEVTEWMNKALVSVPIIIFHCIVVIIGAIGNGHICYIYRPNSDRSEYDSFLYFTGLFDLILPLIIIASGFFFTDRFFYSKPRDVVAMFFAISCTSVMSAYLVAVTVKQCMVVFKHKACQTTLKYAFFFLGFVILVSFLVLGFIDLSKEDKRNTKYMYNATPNLDFTNLELDDPIASFTTISPLWGIVLFLAALIMVGVMDSLIAIKLFQDSKEAGRVYEDEVLDTSLLCIIMERSRESIILHDRARKQTISMMIVSVVFFVSCAPSYVSIIIQFMMKSVPSEMETVILLLFQESYQLNFVIKPIIYWNYYPRFRKECRRILPGIFNNCVQRLQGQGEDTGNNVQTSIV